MKTLISVLLSLIILEASGRPALGRGPALTEAEALTEAKAHSPEVRRLDAAAHEASWRRLEALSEYLPHVFVSTQHLLWEQYAVADVRFGPINATVPAPVPQTVLNLDASLVLFDGLRAFNTYRAAVLNHDAADHELSRTIFRLEHEVRILFYQALAAQELAEVARKNIATLENHLALAGATERAGMGTRFDVLRIEAQLDEARADKVLADDNIAVAREAIFQTMGTAAEDRPLEGSMPVPSSGTVPTGLTYNLSDREDLKAQREREAALNRLSSAAAAFFIPQVSLVGEQQYYRYGTFDPAIVARTNYRGAYFVGLRLTWNVFDGGASLAREREAAYRESGASEGTRASLLRIPNETDLWRRRFLYNTTLYNARLRTVEKSQEAVRLATLGLKAGTTTHTEVLDAELDLFRARAGVVRAQMDAAEALLNLELALGQRPASQQ